jgi:hypothetical protein
VLAQRQSCSKLPLPISPRTDGTSRERAGSAGSPAAAPLAYPDSVILAFLAIQESRDFPANRAARQDFLAYPDFRAAFRVFLEFRGFRVYPVTRGFQANRAVLRGFPAIPEFQATPESPAANPEYPAIERSHNWPPSMRVQLWWRKNFYSRHISCHNTLILLKARRGAVGGC